MSNLPQLRRDRADAKVVGVCAALARAWAVDPTLVRVGFVVLAMLTNGFAALAYLALAALIPERGTHRAPVRDLLPFTRSWSSQKLVLAVIVATLVLFAVLAGSGPGALLVAGIVLAVLRHSNHSRRTPPPPPPPPPPRTEYERLAQAWAQRVDNVWSGLPPDWTPPPARVDPDPYGLYSPAAPVPGPATEEARHPARRRLAVRTWSGIAVALGLVWSGLGALQWGLSLAVTPLAWASATLAVLALALVAVARPARAIIGRPPALLAAVVTTALVVASLALGGFLFTGDTAQRPARLIAHNAATLPDRDTLGIGSRSYDLSEVVVEADRTVELTADLGSLKVVLPREGNVVVRYAVDIGSVSIDGERRDGVDLASTWRRSPTPDAPTLTLDLRVDLGLLEVVQP